MSIRGRKVSPFWSCWLTSLIVASVVVAGGCGPSSDKLNIEGRVTQRDGTPLVGAKVTFRSGESGVSAFGYTDQDGRYSLGTTQMGEGVPPGKYGVSIAEDRGTEGNVRPMTIHPKYVAASRSGIEFTVPLPDEGTNFDIVVDPAR
jgi:hypothetical protein